MACIEVLQGTATWLPYVAADVTTGDPRTSIVFSQIDVSFKKSTDPVFGVKTLTSPEFRENGSGVYEILFSTANLNTLGSFLYVVNGNGTLPTPAVRQFVGQAFIQSASNFTPGTISVVTNIITGNLVDLHGNALPNAAISARVLAAPSLTGASPNIGGISVEMVGTRTDQGGFFALELIQGTLVDITIPEVNYRRTLMVPSNSTDILFDIP